MQHRRTPGGPVAIPATWFIVASALVVIAASAFLGVLLAGGDDPVGRWVAEQLEAKANAAAHEEAAE